MAYAGTVASRPLQIDGGLQTFSVAADEKATVRSQMDDAQTIKTRRRVTRAIKNAQATVTVRGADVQHWEAWYDVNCQNGMLPTRFKIPPLCEEQIWRFSTPLAMSWSNADAQSCQISFGLEKLPQWID
jgi:hypothetical protein